MGKNFYQYSQIGITIKKKDFIKMVSQVIKNNELIGLLNLADMNYIKEHNAITLFWEEIKWRDSFEDIINFVLTQTEGSFRYFKYGEKDDFDFIDIRGQKDDSPFEYFGLIED